MDSIVGSRLGAYQVEKRLGQGGMATVFIATQTSTGRKVAIKTLPKAQLSDPKAVARFEREARVLASLQHPHILPLIDYGEINDSKFLVVPYLAHGDLEDRLGRVLGPLPAAEARRLLVQLAEALAHAHDQGVVHRDLKPGNVLLDAQGNAMLADFGIAWQEGGDRLTGVGFTVGTPEYMAPEQVNGQPEARSDLYALGVLAWRLLTGALPYKGSNPTTTLLLQRDAAVPDPRRANPALDPAVCDFLCKALAKPIGERYQSGAEFAAAVRAVLPETAGAAPQERTQQIDRAALAEVLDSGPRPLLPPGASGPRPVPAAPPAAVPAGPPARIADLAADLLRGSDPATISVAALQAPAAVVVSAPAAAAATPRAPPAPAPVAVSRWPRWLLLLLAAGVLGALAWFWLRPASAPAPAATPAAGSAAPIPAAPASAAPAPPSPPAALPAGVSDSAPPASMTAVAAPPPAPAVAAAAPAPAASGAPPGAALLALVYDDFSAPLRPERWEPVGGLQAHSGGGLLQVEASGPGQWLHASTAQGFGAAATRLRIVTPFAARAATAGLTLSRGDWWLSCYLYARQGSDSVVPQCIESGELVLVGRALRSGWHDLALRHGRGNEIVLQVDGREIGHIETHRPPGDAPLNVMLAAFTEAGDLPVQAEFDGLWLEPAPTQPRDKEVRSEK